MKDQPVWTPAGADITIRWREKYGYVPASELPEIKAKHEYFKERKWMATAQQVQQKS
jgi:hypothetical protein